MPAIPAEITEPRCSCGAQLDKSGKKCRKCTARDRWQRRKAWRSQKDPARYRIGKK